MGKERLKSIFLQNKTRLSLYHTAGYPKLNSMPKVVKAMDSAGIDFIELGMPYSDPLADGPTIQESSTIALKNGITLEMYFDQVQQSREFTEVPLLFMGYFNQVLRYGIDKFLSQCVEVGIDGLILPDMPPDIYKQKYQETFQKYDLSMVFLVTPTCTDDRIRFIDSITNGFVYIVSSSSTTGKTKGFQQEQVDYLKRIQALELKNPTVVGFGISSHETYIQVNEYTSGAIIGSAYIKHLRTGEEANNTIEFVKSILKF